MVPHTGFAERVRQTPAEHGSSGGVRLSPADSGPVQGTNEGTELDSKAAWAPVLRRQAFVVSCSRTQDQRGLDGSASIPHWTMARRSILALWAKRDEGERRPE